MTFREQYEQVLFSEITHLNGDNTEEALNLMITQTIIEERIKEAELKDRNALVEAIFDSKLTDENVEPNGVYLYNGSSIENLLFERFDTIADAVRAGVKQINAKIIKDGDIITYDSLDSDTAYYVDDKKEKVMLVDLVA